MNKNERGFTLLETLIAISILAFSLTTLFEAHTGAIRATIVGDRYARAQILAQSLMAQTVSDRTKPPVSAKGAVGIFDWTIIARPASPSLVRSADLGDFSLYRVAVEVGWERGRAIRLDTLMLARPLERASP